MPFFATRADDGRIVKPSQASKSDELVCRECRDKMGLWDSFETKNGNFVSSHFKHTSDSNCGGGESDRHEEMKEIALHKLQHTFKGDCAEQYADDTYIGENQPDAGIRFENPAFPFGKGILVEAQYKNKDKDIDAVTDNYLREEYTVCWVWEDQYDGRDVDLFGGNVHKPWPNSVPETDEWSGYEYDLNRLRPWKSEWQRRGWVGAGGTFSTRATGARLVADEVWSVPLCDKPEIEATLPPEQIDEWKRDYWYETDWEKRFNPPEEYTDIWCYSKVPAKIVKHWFVPTTASYWNNTPWEDRFRGDAEEHFPGPEARVDATVHLGKWLTDDQTVLRHSIRSGFERETVSEPLEAPANPYLIPGGLLEHLVQLLNEEGIRPEPPDRPPNPFNDVQCWKCGMFWHVSKDRDACPECGAEVDWDWNVETGRIDSQVVE